MFAVNVVVVGGTVSRPPNQRDKMVSFSLCVKKQFFKDGEEKVFTTYIDVKAFGKTAENLNLLQEGDTVLVRGELQTESWEKDGKKQYKTVVTAQNVDIVIGQASAAPAGGSNATDGW